MPQVHINTTQETLNIGLNPAMSALRGALEAAQLFGRYTLSRLQNGRASAPQNVRTLTVGPACKDGVALFFPVEGDPHGLPALLQFEKVGAKMFANPIEFHRKLIDALARSEDDHDEDAPAAPTPPAVGLPAPFVGKGQLAATVRRERSVARVAELLANERDLLVLHRVLLAVATDSNGILKRTQVFTQLRAHTPLVAPADLGKFFEGLVAKGILVSLSKSKADRLPSTAPVRIAPIAGADPAPPVATAPLATPTPTDLPVESVRGMIDRLIARREALRPAHDEFLAIEGELAEIRKLLGQT